MKQFKAYDWARDTRSGMKRPIVQLQPNCIALTNPEEYGKHFIKWIPKPDEWCWFWDYLGFTPTMGIYVGREEENFLADIPNGKGSLSLMSFKYCQPLIGEIPSHLKDI